MIPTLRDYLICLAAMGGLACNKRSEMLSEMEEGKCRGEKRIYFKFL